MPGLTNWKGKVRLAPAAMAETSRRRTLSFFDSANAWETQEWKQLRASIFHAAKSLLGSCFH